MKVHINNFELIKAPAPIESWVGIRNATEFGAKCLQTTFNSTQFWGEEDCLFLNVYTPGKFEFSSMSS